MTGKAKNSSKITVQQFLDMGDSGCYRKGLARGLKISRFPLKKPKGRTNGKVHHDYAQPNDSSKVDGVKLSQHLEIYKTQKALRRKYKDEIAGK